jgi:hypothetical protein
MGAVLIIVISLFVVIAVFLVWYFWDNITTLATPGVTNEYLDVEEKYIIEASDKFRVIQIDTNDEKTIIDGIGDVAHHQIVEMNNPVERNLNGKNKRHYLYLKKDVPYTITVLQKSRNVIWQNGR